MEGCIIWWIMNFRSSIFALLLGAINGFLFGIAFQPVSNSFLEYEINRSQMSLHKVVSPLGEYLFLILLFAIASYTAHRFLAAKIKSDVVLWQVVALIAIAVPSVILYLIEQINTFIGGFQVWLESNNWGNVPDLPSGNDVEFGLLCLCLAITINFFYGAIIAQLQKRAAK